MGVVINDQGLKSGAGCFFFFQAEDGIRDLVRSRGLGDVYKRQAYAVALLLFALLRSLSARALVSATVAGLVGAVLALSLIHI